MNNHTNMTFKEKMDIVNQSFEVIYTPEEMANWEFHKNAIEYQGRLESEAFQRQMDELSRELEELDPLLYYRKKPWQMIPLRGKAPYTKDWPNAVFNHDELIKRYVKGENVGLILGERSNGVVDVDLDCPEAMAATVFLPQGNTRFGRDKTASTHYLYRSENGSTVQFADPVRADKKEEDTMIVELRSTGCQTMIPPSVHPDTGKQLQWQQMGELVVVSPEALEKTVGKVAAASLLARYWPRKGSRHFTAMHLSGALAHEGWSQEEIEQLLRVVVIIAGDEEVKDRLANARTSVENLRAGKPVTGWSKLTETLPHGELIVPKLMEWLNIRSDLVLPKENGYDAEEPEDTDQLWYTETRSGWQFHGKVLAKHIRDTRGSLSVSGQLYLYDGGVFRKLSQTEAFQLVSGYLGDYQAKQNHISDALKFLINSVAVKPEALNNLESVNVSNGLLDPKTLTLNSHNSRVLSTVQLKAAWNETAQCPNFMRYLESSVPADCHDLIQEVVGYALSNYWQAKKMFLLHGPRDSGKSICINIIERLIPGECRTALTWSQLTERFSKINLFGSILNAFADLPEAMIKDGDVIKSLIGTDTITGEYKHGEFVHFKNRATIVFSANGLPQFTGDRSSDFFEKLIMLPFPNTIAKKDQWDVVKATEDEQEGILRWAMVGLQRLINNRFEFSVGESSRRIHGEYIMDVNPVAGFIDESCERKEVDHISKDDLYKKYQEWCETSGCKPMNKKNFGRQINKLGYSEIRLNDKKRTRCWENLTFFEE